MDDIRIQKLSRLRDLGITPYASHFVRTHTLAEGRDLKDGTKTAIAGRIMLLRDMGKMTFLTLQDHTGRLQVLLRKEELGDQYDTVLSLLDLGDFIGIEGARITMGMRAATGAICAVETEGEYLKCRVIGGGAPRGLCGSGLVDAVAVGLCHAQFFRPAFKSAVTV
jgi:lysyl-tRNA synthetase class II